MVNALNSADAGPGADSNVLERLKRSVFLYGILSCMGKRAFFLLAAKATRRRWKSLF